MGSSGQLIEASCGRGVAFGGWCVVLDDRLGGSRLWRSSPSWAPGGQQERQVLEIDLGVKRINEISLGGRDHLIPIRQQDRQVIGDVTVANSTISGNTADDDGGGISADGDVTVADSTISGNTAGVRGGGLDSFRAGRGDVVVEWSLFSTGDISAKVTLRRGKEETALEEKSPYHAEVRIVGGNGKIPR